ncbi:MULTISPECIES: citramalate synthase [unclassified Tolypothrix]|uniref:citramalate synthase n=1 Tax=unclassified Tolypothrix TaxID=2649714 RepID=UPI0005EAB421|nr:MULTISPECIES: citramalate synthase [unclassified Tolypothrix]BAY88867.1 2-isopropylmalate synthase/homocitrate synthase family protein [Microchaete diplosiphon NIES-3275]EKF02719.1 2-isopropylmalate synthase/homocitrate synthase family protein [Tolypothrix sp. PCC 7601]MBE9087595.1 citramalate synthase [Tolypothrix sp. LEGE 11397]UYD29510.1 citramalate synthase [Tolypothrix sp. PCC 7712]UYD34577.1 citramalate synthase [Tolypothrix sp. PCC 7601]
MTKNPSPQIWLYDTTLRDGTQREGLSVSIEDKLRIAKRLDQLGIPFIEGGWPGANPKDVQFFWQLQEDPLKQSEIVAFCSTRRPNTTAASEPMLQAILAAGTRWVTIFGKSWDLHVTAGLKTSLEENLAMIRDTIEYLRSQGRRVIYDAEHWFDGYKHNPDYALQTLETAIASGAEWLVLCDTNGGALPHEVSQIVQAVNSHLSFVLSQQPMTNDKGQRTIPQIGIHTHNDSDMAVANALAAIMAGATMVQGTINGYGERCGNANLCSLIPNLQLKLGYSCIGEDELTQLTEASRFVSEVVNLAPDEHAPFVGRSAFAHKGGIHVSAVERNPLTYEHIQPEQVGNRRRIVISEQSGLSNVLAKARTFGIELDPQQPEARQILQKMKDLESEGYQFEAAEASFALLMHEALGNRPQFFEVKGFQVHCDLIEGKASSSALATIKVAVNGKNILEAAEGNGPVAALDAALRKALLNFYPQIAAFELTDYKVRILNGHTGTAAKTRALVESGNGHQRWTTVGVSPNILEASYQAVVEGLEYGLLLHSQAEVQFPAIQKPKIENTKIAES